MAFISKSITSASHHSANNWDAKANWVCSFIAWNRNCHERLSAQNGTHNGIHIGMNVNVCKYDIVSKYFFMHKLFLSLRVSRLNTFIPPDMTI